MQTDNRQLLGRRLLMLGVLIGAIGFVMLYALVEPSSGVYPRCAFKMLTGLSCPGCGFQRALHAMFGGNIKAAFGYNAFLVVEIPLIALLAFAGIFRNRLPRLNRFLSDRSFIIIILVSIIIWTVVRNIFNL